MNQIIDQLEENRRFPGTHTHEEIASALIAGSWKGEVVFKGETEQGKDWITRNWGAIEFQTSSLENAARWVRTMNSDGLEVALLCGV